MNGTARCGTAAAQQGVGQGRHGEVRDGGGTVRCGTAGAGPECGRGAGSCGHRCRVAQSMPFKQIKSVSLSRPVLKPI